MDIQKLIIILSDLSPNTEQIRKLIVKYNLLYLLPSIQSGVDKLINKEQATNENRILSPYNLNPEVISKIEEKYKIKISKIETKNDLIGGYKIYTKKEVIDNTLSSIIKRIK